MDKTEIKETSFQGTFNLDSILAANAAKKDTVEIKTEVKEVSKPTPVIPEVKQEKPVEAIKEEVKVEPVIEAPVITEPITPTETEAFKIAQRLIQLGTLEDFEVQLSEEGEGVSISEFVDMTDEDLQEIIKISKQEKETEISSKYISKEGLDEHKLKVIEILKNGGDLSQIASSDEKAFERPFEGFDLDVQQRQVDVLYTDLTTNKNLDHASAVVLIDLEVSKGTLKESATKVFETYRKAHAEYIDNKLTEQRKEKEFKDLNFKENKKLLTAKLKEAGLKEGAYKKVSAEYARKTTSGEYALVDKLKEILNNPEENHELILHLADPETFNKLYKIKASQETAKKIVMLNRNSKAKGNRAASSIGVTQAEQPSWLKAVEYHNSNIK